MKPIVKDFFDTHPAATEVHEALGVLFTSADDAAAFCAGSTATPVTHTRNIEMPGEQELKDADGEQETAANEQEQPAPILHNDATTYGKTAEEVEGINKPQKTEKPKTESAKKAAAKGKPKGK
ncbi:MAG: hypothetical protein QM768_21800 [Agriterribacter sp.]